jgi:signal transduction histidine kinase
MGIPFQLRQLFINLLSNSLKFSKEDAETLITISCRSINGLMYEITVEDNGIGFKPGYSQHIFKVFQRLETANQYQGTGIGLAICKKIMENHNGSIVANGEPGKGATFTLHFPVND